MHHIANIQQANSVFLRIPFIRKSPCKPFRLVHTVFYFDQKTFLYSLRLNIDKTAFVPPHPSTRFQGIIQHVSKQHAQIKLIDTAFPWYLYIAFPPNACLLRLLLLLVKERINHLVPGHIPAGIQGNVPHAFQVLIYLLPFFIP